MIFRLSFVAAAASAAAAVERIRVDVSSLKRSTCYFIPALILAHSYRVAVCACESMCVRLSASAKGERGNWDEKETTSQSQGLILLLVTLVATLNCFTKNGMKVSFY